MSPYDIIYTKTYMHLPYLRRASAFAKYFLVMLCKSQSCRYPYMPDSHSLAFLADESIGNDAPQPCHTCDSLESHLLRMQEVHYEVS
jgi:hypothetical protein